MTKLVTYKVLRKAGIDDLEGILGDFTTEWWTDEDWKKWNEDAPNREKRNKERIEKLKEDGIYGQEYYFEIQLIPNPKYDDFYIPKGKLGIFDENKDSFKMDIIDFAN